MTDHKITLTHLNVRQSIAMLLAKLIVTDLILAFIVVGFYFLLVQAEQFSFDAAKSTTWFLVSFGLAGIVKIGLSIYIVLEWLNEYYEITPDAIIHKRGIISRKAERYNLDKVRAIDIHDSFLGELCNYATVTLYDIRLNKYLDMYLIHNPGRYARILLTLRPRLEMKSEHMRIPVFSTRKESLSIDKDSV